MKITKVSVFTISLDQWRDESRYGVSQHLRAPHEVTVVKLDTDSGLVGWGETGTPPPYFLPTLSPSTREGIAYLAPLLLGADPRKVRALSKRAKEALRGHGPSRSAIDMALWDLCGKAAGLALSDLWGGRVNDDLPVLAMIDTGPVEESLEGLAEARRQGYDLFQIKVGFGSASDDITKIRAVTEALGPKERCWFDVNRGWLVDDAVRVLTQVKQISPLIEQPCETYGECLTVSRRTGLGLMLDELLDGSHAMIRAVEDGIMDVAVLKLGLNGGLSELRFLCDLGVSLGVPLRPEDIFGTGMTLAALTHLAHTIPVKNVFGLYNYIMPEVPLVTNPLVVEKGRVSVPRDCGPGLGVTINQEFLGEPVRVFQ